MSCKLDDNRPDWKAYALGEMAAPACRQAEAHGASCNFCQDELAVLRVILDALATLPEEELPRRIAFVSDKVFEPTWWQKWSQTFLRPTFAAGCVIAAAILAHGFMRPDAALLVSPSSTVDTAAIEARVAAEVSQRMQAKVNEVVDDAVLKAVAGTRQKEQQQTNELLAASERRYSEATAYLNRQVTQIYALNSGAGVR